METFIVISRIVHITAGCLALLSGLGAILYRKKTPVHKRFGKTYFWSMTVIFITAMYLSLYRQNIFLFFIGVFTFYSCLTALRSLKLKKLHMGQKPLPVDWLIEVLNICANLGLIFVALRNVFNQELQWGLICGTFGTLGLSASLANIRRLCGKVKYTSYWLIAHISGMLGSYIGAITAFTVNNNRWIHLPDVVAWLLPTVILVPFILNQTAALKAKTIA